MLKNLIKTNENIPESLYCLRIKGNITYIKSWPHWSAQASKFQRIKIFPKKKGFWEKHEFKSYLKLLFSSVLIPSQHANIQIPNNH